MGVRLIGRAPTAHVLEAAARPRSSPDPGSDSIALRVAKIQIIVREEFASAK
jgi:hypothetical protein